MKKCKMVFAALVCFGFCLGSVFAEQNSSPPQASEEMLVQVSREERERRLEEVERALANLERRIGRLDDRFEKLDRDLKDLKRKV